MSSPPLTLTSTLPLPTHPHPLPIPRLGFGIYLSPPSTCVQSCLSALAAGYRHIDSAQYYENEAEMGEAVRRSGVRRSEVFLTTKILSAAGGKEETYRKCLGSVGRIAGVGEGEGGDGDGDGDGEGDGDGDGMEGKAYVDLFLIHSPSGGTEAVREMWGALERLLDEGRARAIGVSNFGVGHIEAMKGYAKVWPPHVNQLELHPYCQQRTIVAYCASHSILVQAYSPLVRNLKASSPPLVTLARKHNRTTAQILVRYSLQKGWVPLPKSDTPSRIEENADVFGFELGEGDMQVLDGLDEGEEGAIVQAVRNE